MAIDRADWHYDAALEQYREKNQITGALSESQEQEVWLLAGNHIGLFLRWVIETGLEGEDADATLCEKVRKGILSGTEYLMKNCDGKFWESDVQDSALSFVKEYYKNQYLDDYAECCLSGDKAVYDVISEEADYQDLKARMDAAYYHQVRKLD